MLVEQRIDESKPQVGGGSSLPGSIYYAYIVAKSKVDLDAAITEPTSWALRVTMPSASADISTDTQLSGCVYMRTGGVLVAKYSDGTDACTYTVAGGWLADDELIIALYTDGVTIQIGIVTAGDYSFGAETALKAPATIVGFAGGNVDITIPGPELGSGSLAGFVNSNALASHTNTTITTTAASTGVVFGPFNAGETIRIVISGTTSAGLTVNSADAATPTARTELLAGVSGRIIWTVTSGQRYIYLRHAAIGSSDISSISMTRIFF